MLIMQVSTLVKKELLLEKRNGYGLASQLLYLGGTVFVCYLSFSLKGGKPNPATWTALFWLVNLFTALSASLRSFQQESRYRFWTYYSSSNPQAIIVSKLLYNTFQMALLGVLAYAAFSVVLGNKVQDAWYFLLTVLLGTCSFAMVLTMVSGIVHIARGSGTLMAILSFPILMPTLLINHRLSKAAFDGLSTEIGFQYWGYQLVMILSAAGLSLILFPYLWRSQSH